MRVAALTALFATAAAAQDRTVLYVNPAPLVTASRLSALGGAAVGMAENSESLPFNYAAAAQRHPHRTGGFDWDVTANILFAPFQELRDTDNEGTPPVVYAPVESQFGGLIQFNRFGIGAYLRLTRRDVCVLAPCDDPSHILSATAAQGSLVFGFNVARDQLVFSGGFFLASASFGFNSKSYDYSGFNLGAGFLWRPHFLPFRIGIHGVSETTGKPSFDAATVMVPELGGRKFFTTVVSPAHISIGSSMRLGAGAWRYNRLSQSALKQLPDDSNFAEVPHDLDPDDPRPPGRFLITVQLDVIFPVKNATTITPFLLGSQPEAIGGSLYLIPRLGFEAEAIDHRLRLRIGGYIEPPFLAGSSTRPHGTFGAEVFLFSLLADWSVSVAADAAARYLSMSFGIGWWT